MDSPDKKLAISVVANVVTKTGKMTEDVIRTILSTARPNTCAMFVVWYVDAFGIPALSDATERLLEKRRY